MTKTEKEQLVLLLNKAIEDEVLLIDEGDYFTCLVGWGAVIDADEDVIIKEL